MNEKKDEVGIDPEKFDLLSIFQQQDLADIDDDELLKRLNMLHDMRKIKLVKTRKKTALDMIMDKLDITNARICAEKLK